MLLRFKSVEQIGRFSKLTQRAEPLAKLSLVFALNGHGKSTLCSILRSAADGKSEHITARRRLGALADSRVESLWATGTFAYSAGKWNGCPGKIHIFDQEFISKNLHVGDSVTRDNKRSLLPIVLGDHGVALANQVNALDKEQRDVDDKRRAEARIIMARCKGISDAEMAAFCKAEVPADLGEKIRGAVQRVELAKQAAVIKQKRNPNPLPLGDLGNVAETLSQTLDGVNENAADLVARHLATHHLGEKAHAWLEYGTRHSPVAECPYCAQGTVGLPLVSAYRAFFSEAFKQLKERIDEVSNILDQLTSAALEERIRINDAEYAYWAKVCDLPSPPSLSAMQQELVGAALSRLKAVVNIKRGNPLEACGFGDDSENIERALGLLAAYNHQVSESNAIIEAARAETDEADVHRVENVHLKWLAMEEKASEPVKSAVAAYSAAETRLEAIRGEKSTAQAALKSYTQTTMDARQAAVNDLLSDFGASFRIVDAKTSFAGREPNTEFALELGTHKVRAGDKSATEPSFKTVLSSGDKTTLALAFFIAQIEADLDLKDAVVIFDDPFNSQDMDRQFQTTSHIRSVCEKACQTLVLSHDPRFLQLIEKNGRHLPLRTFQLRSNDAGEGTLAAWSSDDELKSLYLQQSQAIREYASHQNLLPGLTLNSVHQSIRPFLEDYLRLRFPGRFPDQCFISDMAVEIQKAGSSDPMAAHVSDLFALNEYTRPNMHGGGTNPQPTELRAHCRKVVAIVGSY
ncbi:AAA family ATPase [Bosea sp. UNC402CLCol]|uniref:AAA family ATPase n=1 Tax=Bosea sp. UNC402CLCol TaxID=1510531 RepID=UPI00057146AC|nr:AAA family ATPase [Bosea sp. UNC402CLCol]